MNTTKWILDADHSELQFKVKHMMVSNVTGKLSQFKVKVEADDNSFENAKIALTADMSSISTGNQNRDQHLQNADFFEAEKYPELKFNSTGFKALNEDGDFELEGDLTIQDITKPVKLKVEYGGSLKDPWGNTKAGFSVSGKINRKDWGMTYNAALETGGVLVGDEVRILAEIQLMQEVPVAQ